MELRKIKFIMIMLFSLLSGLYLSYLIHFDFKFFGATFITLSDIISLWLITPTVTCILGLYGFLLSEK